MGGRRRALLERAGDQALRDQEVMRANRELAAYFRGKRTEREARAALKILRAYVRQRARTDPKSRPPLPGAQSAVEKKGGSTRTPKRPAHPRRHRSRPPSDVQAADVAPRDEPKNGDD